MRDEVTRKAAQNSNNGTYTNAIRALIGQSKHGLLGGQWLSQVRVAHGDADLNGLADKIEAAQPGSVERVELPANKADRLAFIRNWQKENAGKAKTGMAMTLMLPLVACGGGGGGSDSSGAGTGFAIKGALSGSNVEYSTDGGTTWVSHGTTGSDGSFSLAGIPDDAEIRVTGGTDVTTGAAWAGELSATSGSTYVTPLTTLVKARVDAGDSEADANTAIKQALGIDSDADLGAFDPNDDVSAYLASVKVAATALVASAGGAGSFSEVLTNLANDLNTAAGSDQTLDDVLNDTNSSVYDNVADLDGIINDVESLFDSIDTDADDAFDKIYDALRYVSDDVKATVEDAAEHGGLGGVSVEVDIDDIPAFNAVAQSASLLDAPENGVYLEGDEIQVVVTFNEDISLAGGTPEIAITFGEDEVTATYDSTLTGEQEGDNKLVFSYTVSDGATVADADGIEIGGVIDLNGATLTEDDGGATTTSAKAMPPVDTDEIYVNAAPEDVTVSLTAAEADGKTIAGDGTVEISDLEDTLDADLSGITTSTLSVDIDMTGSDGLSLTGNLGKAEINVVGSGSGLLTASGDVGNSSFVIGSDVRLTLSEAQADGRTITGSGTYGVSSLAADTDLSEVNVSGTVFVTIANDVDITANSNLSSVDRYEPQTGHTLTMSAAQADGLWITGAGDVAIEDADGDTAYDFSDIEATATLQIDAETDLHDDAVLGDVNIAFTSDVELTLTTDQVNGRTITGTGDLVITGEFGDEVDLSGIASTVDFTLVTEVGADQTLVLSEDQADGKEITGDGNLKVTGVAGDTDLSNVAVEGNVVATVESDVDISGNNNLGNVTQYQVASGNTLTISSTQAGDLDAEGITGDGNVTVDGIADGTDFDGIDIGGELILVVDSSADLTSNDTLNAQLADSIEIQVASGQTVTLTAAQANGVSITGDGNVTISSPVEADADLSGIAATGTVTLPDTVNDGFTLTLTAAQANGATIGGDTDGDNDAVFVITDADAATAYDVSGVASGSGTTTVTYATGGTLNGSTDLGDASVVVADGQTLTLTAAQGDGVTIASSGADDDDGSVVLTGADAATEYDFTSISSGSGTVSVTYATGGTLSSDTDLGGASIVVADGQTLTLTADQADGATISSSGSGDDDGNVVITGLDATVEYDFSNISSENGDVSAEIGTGGTLNSATDLGGVSLTVADGETLELTAAQANGVTIGGDTDGDDDAVFVITEAEAATEYDVSGVASGSGTTTVTYATGGTLNASTDLGDASVVVADGETLTLTAAQANGATIGGDTDGDNDAVFVITDADAATAYDVSGVASGSGTTTVTYATGGTLNGSTDLGDASVVVADGQTLTLTVGQADGLTIASSGADDDDGSVVLTGADAATEYDFTSISSGSGTVSVTYATGGTLSSDTDLGGASIVVADGQTLTLTADQADGATISSSGSGDDDGNVVITGLDATVEYDFSNISSENGDVSAEIGTGGTLNSATDLGGVSLTVADGETLELTAAQANGVTIGGDTDGDDDAVFVITEAEAATEYDVSGVASGSGTTTVTYATGGTLNASTDLGDASVVVADGETLTLTAAQANGATIGGDTDGDNDAVFVITDADAATAYDVSGVASGSGTTTVTYATGGTLNGSTDLGDASVVVADGQTLTLTAAQGDGVTIASSGADDDDGSVVLTGADAATEYDFTSISSGSGTVSVTYATGGTLSSDTDLGGASIVVADGQTLTLTADQADGATISSSGSGDDDGNVVITGLDATVEYDFSNISSENGDVSAEIGTGGTLNSATDLGGVSLTVADGETLELTAAQANGVTIGGDTDGDDDAVFVITEAEAATEYDVSGVASGSGTTTVTYATGGTLNASTDLGDASVVVADGETLTLTAAQANGATIGGDTDGDNDAVFVITDADAATAYDVSGVASGSGTTTVTYATGGTLNGSTDLGDASVVVADGQTLTLTVGQADGLTIASSGADDDDGSVVLTGADAATEYDFTSISSGSGTVSVTYATGGTLSSDTDLGGASIVVADGQTLTLTADQADGATISSSGSGDDDGNVVITGLDATVEYDFSNISSENGDVSAEIGTGGTLNSATDLGGVSLTVADGETLELTAAQANGVTIGGDTDGDDDAVFVITEAEAATEYDVSGVASGSGTTTVTYATGGTLNASTDLGDASVVVADGETLTLTAAQANGATIGGDTDGDNDGSVVVADLDQTLAADLSSITAETVTAAFDDDGTFTGNLGDASVTVASGVTMTLAADVASGSTIAGDGTVTITALDGDAAYDFSGIEADTITAFTLDGDLDLDDATDLGNLSLVVNDPDTLTLTAAQADGLTVSGTGAVTVEGLTDDTDLSNVTVTGTVTAAVESTADISGNANLDVVDTYTIASGQILTLSASQAHDKTVGGTGTANISSATLSGEVDLSAVSTDTTVTFDGGTTVSFATGALVTADLAHVDTWTMTDNDDVTLVLTGIEATSDIGAALTGATFDSEDSMIVADFTGTMTFTGNVTDVDFLFLSEGADIDIAADTTGVDGLSGLMGSGDVTFTTGDGGVNVDLSGLQVSVQDNEFTGTATIEGGTGDDTLTGTAADDVISASDGANTIAGGEGGDTMSGGIGVDTYQINLGEDGSGNSHSTIDNMDHITDLVVGTDLIDLQNFDNSNATIENGATYTLTWDGVDENYEDSEGNLVQGSDETDVEGDEDLKQLIIGALKDAAVDANDAQFIEFSGGSRDGETYLFLDDGDGIINDTLDTYVNLTGLDTDSETDLTTVLANM